MSNEAGFIFIIITNIATFVGAKTSYTICLRNYFQSFIIAFHMLGYRHL